MKLNIVTNNSRQFTKAHDIDAGYDILSSEDIWIRPGEKELILTGLKVAIPAGYVGIIKSRSGLSVKHNLEVGAGVIDSGYTGEVRVVLRNLGNEIYCVKSGDKIAQMIIVNLPDIEIVRVDNLNNTERGEGGFNSTGY